jgi:hypothetical protein
MAFRTVCAAGSSAAKTIACFAFPLLPSVSQPVVPWPLSLFRFAVQSRDALLEVVSRGFVLLFQLL